MPIERRPTPRTSRTCWPALEPWAARVYTDCSAPVRERLGEAELAAAWAAGRALSEADAAAYALTTVAD